MWIGLCGEPRRDSLTLNRCFKTRELTGSVEIHQGPHVAKTRQAPTQDRLLGCSGLVIWKSPLQGQAWNAHLSYSIEGGSKGTHPRRHRLSVDSSAVTPDSE